MIIHLDEHPSGSKCQPNSKVQGASVRTEERGKKAN